MKPALLQATDGIDVRAGPKRLACQREIGPRRNASDCGRKWDIIVAKRESQGYSQATPSRVACDNDLLWRDSVVDQPAISSHTILKSGREWMLGRKAILGLHRRSLASDRNARCQGPMGRTRPHRVGSTMQVQNRSVMSCVGRSKPLSRDVSYGRLLHIYAGWYWQTPCAILERRPLLLQSGVLVSLLDPIPEYQTENSASYAWHLGSNLSVPGSYLLLPPANRHVVPPVIALDGLLHTVVRILRVNGQCLGVLEVHESDARQ